MGSRDAKVNPLFETIVNSILEEFSQGCSFFPPSAFHPDCSFFLSPFFFGGDVLVFTLEKRRFPRLHLCTAHAHAFGTKKREMEDRAAFSVTSFGLFGKKKKKEERGTCGLSHAWMRDFQCCRGRKLNYSCVLYAGKFVKSTSVTLTDPIYL